MTETVSILGGTGNLGFGLAVRLGAAGYAVCLGSRDSERARDAAVRARDLIDGGTFIGRLNDEAVAQADRLIVAAVPFVSHASTLNGVADSWRPEHVLLDTTVPLATAIGGRATHLVEPWHGSAAQQARATVNAEVAVASGLHTISAAALRDLGRPLDQDTLICGDRRAKDVVTDVLQDIDGLRVVDAGSLEMSRLLEGLTPVLIGINMRNKTHAGIQVTRLDVPRGTRPQKPVLSAKPRRAALASGHNDVELGSS